MRYILDENPKEPSLVLIVKWGGELTPAGKFQAEDLGKAFRTLYPGGQGNFYIICQREVHCSFVIVSPGKHHKGSVN